MWEHNALSTGMLFGIVVVAALCPSLGSIVSCLVLDFLMAKSCDDASRHGSARWMDTMKRMQTRTYVHDADLQWYA